MTNDFIRLFFLMIYLRLKKGLAFISGCAGTTSFCLAETNRFVVKWQCAVSENLLPAHRKPYRGNFYRVPIPLPQVAPWHLFQDSEEFFEFECHGGHWLKVSPLLLP